MDSVEGMARPLRIEKAGGWYHVTGRGNERRPIYRDDRDRQHFCQLLAQMVDRFAIVLHAYVLMDNYCHLILELTEPNLSRAIQWLNVSYSGWFNRRHGRSGHLFQGRFKSVAVSPTEWGLELSRYVHLNPVRLRVLGLGKSERTRMAIGASSAPQADVVARRLQRLRSYPWSSYRAYIGLARKPEWLECEAVLELGGGKRAEQQKQYRQYVETAVREGLEKSPWEELKEQVVLGSEAFVKQLRGHVRGNAREQRGAGRLTRVRPKLDQVIAVVEKLKREKWRQFRDRYGDGGRDLVLYVGQRVCGMTLAELAEACGMRNYSAAGLAIRRYEQRLPRDKSGQAQLKRCCQLLNVAM